MNVIRLPASVSGWTNLLLRAFPWRRGKETARTVGGLVSGATGECGCRTVTLLTSDLGQPHDHETEKYANVVVFSVHSDNRFKRTGHRTVWRVLPFSLRLSRRAACMVEGSPLHPPQPLRGTRQFHIVSTLHTGLTGTRLQRGARSQTEHGGEGAGRPRKKRLPLSRAQEIEEVLEEHADTIADFAAVLGVSHNAVRDMARRDTRLLTQFHKEAVIAKMRLLLDHGFPPAEILSRYQVFSRSLHHLESGLRAMAATRHYRYRLATLLLSHAHFEARMAAHRKEVAIMGDHSSQTSFMAELLECSTDEISALAVQYEFLLTLPPSRLQEIVAVLRSFGFDVADIRSKCLMLRCPPEVARERLQRVSEAGVLDKQLVPYILTNSDTHFEASFATWTRNADALGTHANERELLMHKLGCSEDEVRVLMRRKRQVAGMKSAKLQQCLEVLQREVGLSSETILHQGGLLYYSPQRLRSRWALLRPLGLSERQLARDMMLTEKKFVAKYDHGSD